MAELGGDDAFEDFRAAVTCVGRFVEDIEEDLDGGSGGALSLVVADSIEL